MSRVARSARVASRQRTETVSGTKVITQGESGELYLVTGASTITLPEPEEGSYFKFFIGGDIISASALIIQSHAAGSADFLGNIAIRIAGGTGAATDDAAAARALSGDGHDKLTIGDSAKKVHVGSYVECFSNGTNWGFSGFILAEHANVTAEFGDQ